MALCLSNGTDAVSTALDNYRRVSGYRATLATQRGGTAELIRYAYRRPGLVRIEFVTPHRGAVLIYNPASGMVKLWPFGHRRFPALSLSPSNPLIQSPSGQRVDRSDVGALYQHVRALQAQGVTEVCGVEPVGAREAVHLDVRGAAGRPAGRVAGYRLWLDCDNGFPLKVTSIDGAGTVIETVEMAELCIAPDFPDDFFRQ